MSEERTAENDAAETGATDAQVEAAARAIHAHQEYSTCWDDERAGSLSRKGTEMRPLGEHGRAFYRGLARAALSAVIPYRDGQRDLAAKVEAAFQALARELWRKAAKAGQRGSNTEAVNLRYAANRISVRLTDLLADAQTPATSHAAGDDQHESAAERPGNGAQSAEQTSGASLDVRDAAGLSEAHSGSEVGLADCGRRHPGMCAMVGGVCLQPVAETRDGGAGL